jgi:arsenical pump membrane protein
LHRRTVSPTGLLKAAHVSFAVFVLALSLAVAAAGRTFLADVLTTLLHSLGIGAQDASGTPSLSSLLLLVALSTVLANLVNNLPAVLLLVPVVAPWGTIPLLVVLVGVNVGAGLTYPGSLANLLWRRVLVRAGAPPSARTFHLQAVCVVPVALTVGVCTLWAEATLGWLR